MYTEIISAVFLPFLGTVIGSGCVFFLKGQMNRNLQRSLTGFAAGVMVAASVWSLIIPAMEQSEHMGKLAFFPAFVGVWAGFLFLLALDEIIPHLHLNAPCPEGKSCNLGKYQNFTDYFLVYLFVSYYAFLTNLISSRFKLWFD